MYKWLTSMLYFSLIFVCKIQSFYYIFFHTYVMLQIDNFYQHAISSPHRNISLEFRPQYFKWFITHNDDIETVRGMYSNLYILQPVCHELFECMAEYEKMKNEKNIGKRRKVWLDAVNEFGLNDFRK